MKILVAKLGSRIHRIRVPKKTTVVDAIRMSGEDITPNDDLRLNGLELKSFFQELANDDAIFIVRRLKGC